MADVRFSPRAYCKMLLHCAKYPHCAVNGVLLAESSNSKESKGDGCLTYIDAVPLFHICLYLSPMYEIALTQIENMASAQGLEIAGYYIANENYREINSETGHKLADKIAENFPSACLVVIDNKKFPSCYPDEDAIPTPPLIISQFSDGKWKSKERTSIVVSKETQLKAGSLLSSLSDQLVDFDNHLDDISLDWKNMGLHSEIDAPV